MEIKSVNPKIKQSKFIKELNCSTSTLQNYKQNKNMLPPYRIPSKTHKIRQKILKKDPDDSHPDFQLTSNDFKITPKDSITIKRSKLKVGNPSVLFEQTQ